MGKKNKNKKEPAGNSFFERLLFKAFDKFGLIGFITISAVLVLLYFPSDDQKHDFFDQYILFKNTKTAIFELIGITIFFGVLFIIERLYHNQEIETLNKKISRLKEKTTN